MENKVIEPFYHTHPLILIENVSEEESLDCYACGDPVTNLERAYVCTQRQQYCSDRITLHRKCGELPSEIWHLKHPQHPLHLFDHHKVVSGGWCDVCLCYFGPVLGYRCLSCDFDVDLTCKKISIDVIVEGKKTVEHPSHPNHPLTLMRKPPFPFCCDGCGVEDVGMAYICSTCEFMIHESCASLPLVLPINRLYHHHHFSLAFTFPMEHRKYIYNCDVCGERLDRTCWVYFCGDCRFFAHIRCVASTAERESSLEEDDSDGSDVIQFPLHAHDISKEMITPFVMREKGLSKIPDMPATVNMPQTTSSFSFLFNYHNHPLSLVSEPSHDDEHDHSKITDDDDEDDDKEEELKICDVCVTPISSPPYYECADCKYFVHSICNLLPKTLSPSSSSHLHGDHCPISDDENHRFTLYTSSELTDTDYRLCKCEICKFVTNGMMYECEECRMKIDIKCASLPTAIKYASHRQHKPLILTRTPPQKGDARKKPSCHSCEGEFDGAAYRYCCSNDGCDFALDLKCAMLPLSITNHEWEKPHPLLLTSDASLDHPSDFFCEFCEEELNPKKWMYHCRQCDHSFHLFCLKAASGWFRNVKFGRRFVLDGIHPHSLTFNCVTLKKRCDICGSNVYDFCGLECALCNYVVCIVCTMYKLAYM